MPHFLQWNSAWLSRLFLSQCPHSLHVWDVYAGLTNTNGLWFCDTMSTMPNGLPIGDGSMLLYTPDKKPMVTFSPASHKAGENVTQLLVRILSSDDRCEYR